MEIIQKQNTLNELHEGDKILELNYTIKVNDSQDKERIENLIQGHVIAARNKLIHHNSTNGKLCPLTRKRTTWLTEKEAISMGLMTSSDAKKCKKEGIPKDAQERWIDFNESFIAIKKNKRSQFTVKLRGND